jgi:hypothetical protein
MKKGPRRAGEGQEKDKDRAAPSLPPTPSPCPSWREAAQRRHPDAPWIDGHGPIVVVLSGQGFTFVTLHATMAEAKAYKAHIERQLSRHGMSDWTCSIEDLCVVVA